MRHSALLGAAAGSARLSLCAHSTQPPPSHTTTARLAHLRCCAPLPLLPPLIFAEVVFGDVMSQESLRRAAFGSPVDVVVSCLASRTGGIKDSWDVDYQASLNALEAGAAAGTAHYVLLSAICVQKPLLEFQRAKLAFEERLAAQAAQPGGLTYSIVRPTAFFKSLAGQVALVQDGKPYVYFGDGRLAACKPISEQDLAAFIADCVAQVGGRRVGWGGGVSV